MDQQTRVALGRLTDPARTHGQLRADAIAARDEAIWRARREQGATVAEIRAATGLGQSTVYKILLAQDVAHQRVQVGEGA
jgi:hypothetical protein